MTYKKDEIVGNGFKFVSYKDRKNGRPQAEVICPHCSKAFVSDLIDIERKKKSCLPCVKKMRGSFNRKHGYSRHPLAAKYKSMKSRCYNSKDVAFKSYGGKGITICDEWLDDKVKFFKWAEANGYKKGLEIDRIDNDNGYSPDNCRFVTREVNQKNMGKLQDRTKTKYGYFGVKPQNKASTWTASFTYKGKTIKAGTADTKEEAAKIHDAYVILHKLDRKLNFP